MAVKYNMPNINTINRNTVTALKQAATATHTDITTAGVIPFDVGTMQNEGTFVDNTDVMNGHAQIVTAAPQAARLYYHPEYDFQTVNNENARGGWFDPWISGSKKDFAKNAFAQRLKALNAGVK